ncbi:helix-turn-helix transcriptional regulator [Pseudactinotalea terrae]|uniref:helix-turn-helix transcriptional regulator n=1 Tax=Pseudactinotalea terrae TaxID=1743262 RepID=UPI0012E0E2BC|nr:WYL domain-containing protein [Pseudactinotalea terrae]
MGLDGDSPTARALLALALIQDSPGITAAELGAELGVSDRAARRYAAILREADIPVESTAGRYGGYQIGRGFRPPPLSLTLSEALGLTLSAVESRHGRDDAAGRALAKLTRVLPASLAGAIEEIRSSIPTPPPGPEVDGGIVAQLVDAAAKQQVAQIRYRGEHVFGTAIEPWGVVPRRGYWYLLCWSRDREARRLYRVDRIESVRVAAETFERPDVDLLDVVEEHLSEGWEHAVEVVIQAPTEQVRWWIPRQLGSLEEQPDGSTRLRGSTSTPDWYAVKLAEIAAPFRVIAPAVLAEEVRRLGQRLIEAAQPGAETLNDR